MKRNQIGIMVNIGMILVSVSKTFVANLFQQETQLIRWKQCSNMNGKKSELQADYGQSNCKKGREALVCWCLGYQQLIVV